MSDHAHNKILRLFDAQNGVCHWCGMEMMPPDKGTGGMSATLDHLVPKNAPNSAGPFRPRVAAHRLCNNARHHGGEIPEDVLVRVRRGIQMIQAARKKQTAARSSKVRAEFS